MGTAFYPRRQHLNAVHSFIHSFTFSMSCFSSIRLSSGRNRSTYLENYGMEGSTLHNLRVNCGGEASDIVYFYDSALYFA